MSTDEEIPHLNEPLRKIAKGSGIVFIGTAIGMAFVFFTKMTIARFLGPYDYGLVSLGIAALTITATLGLLGLGGGIVRYVSFYKGREDSGRIKGTIISSLKISFPLGLVLACLLFFSAEWLSINIFHESNLTPVLQIFSIAVPFYILSQIFVYGTIGFQEMKYQVYVNNIFQNVFRIVMIAILLFVGLNVLRVTLSWVLPIVIMPFLALYFLEKKVFPVFRTEVKGIKMEKEILSFSLPLLFVGISGLIMGYMDMLMLGYFHTSQEVGIYSAVIPVVRLTWIPVASLGSIFAPVITELYSKGMHRELSKTYSIVTKWLLFIVLPISLLICLFSGDIMKILFGTEYIAGAIALSVLTVGYLISQTFNLSGRLLTAFGRTKIVMGCHFAGAGMNFIFNILLIPIYGVNGAAVATASSLAFANFLLFLFARRIGKMQPFRLSHLKPIFASLIALFVIYIITKYFLGITLYTLIIMLFAFLVLYSLVLLLLKGFESEDLMIMKTIEEKSGLRFRLLRRIIKRFL